MDTLFSSFTNLGSKLPKNDATITRKKDDATVKIETKWTRNFRTNSTNIEKSHREPIGTRTLLLSTKISCVQKSRKNGNRTNGNQKSDQPGPRGP